MIIGSVFSGGGGGDLGFLRSGHSMAFGCEIDKYARSVLRFNHPDLLIYNDIKEITRERLVADRASIPNLIFGGSPCQDLSVAGNREGMGGEHSGLFAEQCRVADEISADWFIWENVIGALSSNKGRDFSEVLGYVTGFFPDVPSKGWLRSGVCIGPKRVAVWRVLDALAFGVPQRRRRIFLVAGPRALAGRIIDILFEPESGEWDNQKSRQSRKIHSGEVEGFTGDVSVEALENEPYVAFDSNYSGRYDINNDGSFSPTLKVASKRNGQPPAIGVDNIIRRLTPLECERLMGWPDNYTKNGINDSNQKIELSNKQRYRICGNGIVLNVTNWIGRRLPDVNQQF